MSHSNVRSIVAMLFVVQMPHQEPTFRPVSSSPSSERIIGGKDCDVYTYPFVVSIMPVETVPRARETIGGTLIRPQWVLSSARFFPKRQKRWALHQVQAGSSNSQRNTGERPQVIFVSKAYFHDDYIMHDLVLVRLKTAFELNNMVALARLPRRLPAPPPGVATDTSTTNNGSGSAVIMGWGGLAVFTDEEKMKAVPSEKLQCVELPVVDETACKKVFDSTIIPGTIFCLQPEKEGTGTCYGDAGGPVVFKDAPNIVIGIVSRSPHCGKGPLVVTKVEAYLDWINETIILNCSSPAAHAVEFLFVLSVLINLCWH